MPKRRYWTAQEVAELQRRYPDEATKTIAADMDRSDQSLYTKAFAIGLEKSAVFMAGPHAGRLHGKRGKASRFAKGHVPHNKGVKGWQAGGRSELTQFKPGHRPVQAVPVGTCVLSTPGSDGYCYYKTKIAEPNIWKWTHRLNWQAAHGAIPKGLCLVFKDHNRENCSVENLELVTRGELMRRNTIHRYPPNLKFAIRLQRRLKRKVKETANEKQD